MGSNKNFHDSKTKMSLELSKMETLKLTLDSPYFEQLPSRPHDAHRRTGPHAREGVRLGRAGRQPQVEEEK